MLIETVYSLCPGIRYIVTCITCINLLEDQTVEHILQKYQQSKWPIETLLQTKLFGDKEELEKAIQLTLQTGLSDFDSQKRATGFFPQFFF